jgi:hypothetical protein
MFKKSKQPLNIQPTERGLYAFIKERCGDFLLFVEEQKDCYKFIYLPGPSDFYLTTEDFTKSIKGQILEFVEQVPEDIFLESVELSKQNKVALSSN